MQDSKPQGLEDTSKHDCLKTTHDMGTKGLPHQIGSSIRARVGGASLMPRLSQKKSGSSRSPTRSGADVLLAQT